MGFCHQKGRSFLKFTPFVENSIIGSGVILIKYWWKFDMEEQAKRFRSGMWTIADLEAQPDGSAGAGAWYDYSRARDAMFAATARGMPWYVCHRTTSVGRA